MTRGSAAVMLGVAVLLVGCTSDDGAEAEPAPPTEETPDEPTPEPTEPAFDPTEGVDPGLVAFYGQDLLWEPCDEFECATVEVPLDYADPSAASVELAVLRSVATRDDRLGSLLINPGGPGGSGVEAARNPMVATDAVRSRYDIVGFDPRGVASSTPIDCLDDDDLDRLISTEAPPRSEDDVEGLEARYEAFVDGCVQRSGELLAHIGTENVARDLDILRAVLGDASLNYLGRSYGAYIGAIYAELFPERVGRMVLDGGVDPSLTGGEFALGQTEGAEQALRAYLEWCIDQNECPLGRTIREAYGSVVGVLDVVAVDPLPTADPARPLTESLALYGLIMPLYVPPEQGYEVLTAALGEALAGNGEILSDLADIYLDRNPDGTFNGNQNEVLVAVHCLDRPDLTDPDEIWASLEQFEEASPLFGPYLAWSGLACASWPYEPVAEPAPVSASGAEPIVVVGTTGDHATPYEWSEALAGQLESGVLLTFDGFGHLAYNRADDDCVDDAVDDFLLDGEVPEDGLVCS